MASVFKMPYCRHCSKLYLKKFKQFSLGDLLVYIEQNYDKNFRKYFNKIKVFYSEIIYAYRVSLWNF